MHLINVSFYIGLTLMLGAIFDHRAPVIRIPLAFLFFGQQYLAGLHRGLVNVLPLTLTMPMNDSPDASVAMALMTGTQPGTYLPVATVLAAAALFVAIACWVFQRQEL